MAKTVIYSVEGTVVKGDFDAAPGDSIMLLGRTQSGIHIWRDGEDVCNLLGCPCPLEPMTSETIPMNEYTMGMYSIGTTAPSGNTMSPVLTNGELVVGSGRPRADGGRPRDRSRE